MRANHFPNRFPNRFLRLVVLLALSCVSDICAAAHAIAMYGEPKYPAGFSHFDYANPLAPKGGTINLAGNAYEAANFDKLNPFTLRGRAPTGLLELVFDTLMVYSMDEQMTQYGLLAESVEVASDQRSATFKLHPRARFSNGDPVTASDVKYSFDTLTGEHASPKFKSYFGKAIARLDVVDARSVRFEFTRPEKELVFVAGALPVFSPKWGNPAGGEPVPFDAVVRQDPVASGPYSIDRIDYTRGNVVYRRNPDYWGANLPSRRGTFNFDSIVFKMVRDHDLQVEAFKAGVIDLMAGGKARDWCCVFTGVRFTSGEASKKLLPHQNLPAMNGYIFNLRRAKFQDVRVRKALSLAFDFHWVNEHIFYREYRQPYSYFSTTDLAAEGLPSEQELVLLEPYRQQLDPAVFGPMVDLTKYHTVPPRTLRDNIIEGQRLLAEAGWVYRDGALRNPQGEPFVLEVDLTEGIPLPRIETYLRNLGLYGIEVRRRLSDAVTSRRNMQQFNFDLTNIVLRESRMPGGDIAAKFHSKDADVEGSENTLGVKSPAIDYLLEKFSTAKSYDELRTAARALDRVLMHGYYIVPERYMFEHRTVFATKLGYPATLPSYYNIQEWALAYWWDKQAQATTTAQHVQ